MVAIAYLVIAFMSLVALYYAVKLWRGHPNSTTLLILIPLVFLWLDNFAIATGKWFGPGLFLDAMTYLRFYWHWQMLPLLIIVAGALARRAGFKWAQSRIVMGLFCLAAVFFMVEDVPYLWKITFQPACFGDTFRYTINVAANQICEGFPAPFKQPSPSPAGAITTNLVLMVVGFMLWVRHKFPWLALSCLFTFVCSGVGAMPGLAWGQLLGNLGEPVFNYGLIAAGFRFATAPKAAGPVAVVVQKGI